MLTQAGIDWIYPDSMHSPSLARHRTGQAHRGQNASRNARPERSCETLTGVINSTNDHPTRRIVGVIAIFHQQLYGDKEAWNDPIRGDTVCGFTGANSL